MSIEEFTEDQSLMATGPEALLVDLDGFEGPIDVLLQLARDQKVDITRISILALAEQYLSFVREARRLRLELAADYLVMAAWLAYLKSRLLLPEEDDETQEPSGAEMAAALRFQLQRLEAIQDAGVKLFERALLGQSRFVRGVPEAPSKLERVVYEASLYDLLKAYGRVRQAHSEQGLHIKELNLYSVEQAVRRLCGFLGKSPGWQRLFTFMPHDLRDNLTLRSAVASTFVAGLELAKFGRLDIRQDKAFAPIFVQVRKGVDIESEEGLDLTDWDSTTDGKD